MIVMKMIVMIVVVMMMNEWNNENDGELANLENTDSFIFSHHIPDHPTDSSS